MYHVPGFSGMIRLFVRMASVNVREGGILSTRPSGRKGLRKNGQIGHKKE